VAALLDELVPEALSDPCMGFALQFWDAWSHQNYTRLFRLYKQSPKMTGGNFIKNQLLKIYKFPKIKFNR
jgi:hypothetical protein